MLLKESALLQRKINIFCSSAGFLLRRGEHDAADAEARIQAPVLALWGAKGVVGALYDVLQTWREKAVDVRGRALPCGHTLQEEVPEETLAELLAFLGE